MNIYELIGLIIGDGYIAYNKKKRYYFLEITGDVLDDTEFFEKISHFLYNLTGKKPIISLRKRETGQFLQMHLNYKSFVEYLINKLDLPFGKKTFLIKIPEKFNTWKELKDILRGIFEADGSLYFSKSKKNKYPTYPRIEFRTSSQALAFQILNILKKQDFNMNIMKTKYKDYKIYLSGEIMLEKWVKEIGFSNLATITKYDLWKKLGFYIPKITFEERKKLLKAIN
ncbi:hypothetical protein J4449_03035 [Candidatus Woesearchaeota archaeon]|nr:hypothetical protein [Candidatus Woesearchaeota archaeon]